MDKRRVAKTLYVENLGKPLRILITKGLLERTKELRTMLKKIPLKRNEFAKIEIDLRNCTILIQPNEIDIGSYGYEGWDSFLGWELPKNLDDLPDVYFSEMYLLYLKDENDKITAAKFKEKISKKHRELLVWKKIEGGI